jgi:ferredoxin
MNLQNKVGSVSKLIAMHTYHGTEASHLSFPVGAIIVAKPGQDGNLLWFGRCNNREGWFPPSYCRLQRPQFPMASQSPLLSRTTRRSKSCNQMQWEDMVVTPSPLVSRRSNSLDQLTMDFPMIFELLSESLDDELATNSTTSCAKMDLDPHVHHDERHIRQGGIGSTAYNNNSPSSSPLGLITFYPPGHFSDEAMTMECLHTPSPHSDSTQRDHDDVAPQRIQLRYNQSKDARSCTNGDIFRRDCRPRLLGRTTPTAPRRRVTSSAKTMINEKNINTKALPPIRKKGYARASSKIVMDELEPLRPPVESIYIVTPPSPSGKFFGDRMLVPDRKICDSHGKQCQGELAATFSSDDENEQTLFSIESRDEGEDPEDPIEVWATAYRSRMKKLQEQHSPSRFRG